jgi:hypothetical protein
VLEHGYRLKEPSHLFLTISAADPMPEHASGTVFAGADIPTLDMARIAYFGASVFWRAAQPVWPLARGPEALINLGPYQEPLRRFLLGEVAFPEEMALWVAVCRAPAPPPVISFPAGGPATDSHRRFHRHTFDIPGLSYMLSVGRSLPSRLRETCVLHSPRRPLFFTPVERIIERNVAALFSKSPPSPSLRKLHRTLWGEELEPSQHRLRESPARPEET